MERKLEALYAHEAQMVLTIADMQHHLKASGLDIPGSPRSTRTTTARRSPGASEPAPAVAAQSGLACTYAGGISADTVWRDRVARKGTVLPEDV